MVYFYFDVIYHHILLQTMIYNNQQYYAKDEVIRVFQAGIRLEYDCPGPSGLLIITIILQSLLLILLLIILVQTITIHYNTTS